jgi:UPF0755 protein
VLTLVLNPGWIHMQEKSKKPNRLRPSLLGLVALSLLLIAFLVWFDRFSPNRSAGSGEKRIEFEIELGSGPQRVARLLADAGLIRDPDFFRILVRVTGNAGRIKTGLYELNDAMSSFEILNVITEGRVAQETLTIPEGWNNRQIGDYLVEKGFVNSRNEFLSLTEDPQTLARYRIPASSTEGYLYPDTYTVPRRYPVRKIHERMLERFFQMLQSAEPPASISAADLHQKIIMASIIEREAAHPDELPVMAQVFQNRIRKRMRLESCATVQYLLPKPQAKLYEKDLLIRSPYNTYLHRGLPPGPISNPGLPAIRAVFHPEPVGYLFFVLKPEQRRHHFSSDFKEHLEAKKRYLGD